MNKVISISLYKHESGRTAFNYYKEGWHTITYGEFMEKTTALSSYLINKGIRKGQKVAIISENRYEWCSAFLAIVSIGAISVPIDVSLTPDEIDAILMDSETKLIFHSEQAQPPRGFEPTLNFDSKEFALVVSAKPPFPHVNEDDIAVLVYTSGTTGIPKAVMLTHKNLYSDIDALIKAGVIDKADNVLSALPLHHTYALMCTFLLPISLGAEITYPRSLKGPELVSDIKEKAVTIFISVPRMLELIRQRLMERLRKQAFPIKWLLISAFWLFSRLRRTWDINIGKVIFSPVHRAFGRQLKFIASGGARLEPEVMKDLEALGFTILEGYGLTETSPVVTFNPSQRRKPGSVGKPLSSVEIKIINPTSQGEGEVAIKCPMLMKGYYKNQKATDSVIKDGFLLSGDLGYLDTEGYLFLTGRKKDLIVLSSGKNVYPEEVERQYSSISLIKELCVMADAGRLKAIIVPDMEYAKKEQIGNINEALRWQINMVSQKLPPHMRLLGYTLYPQALPKTPIGKLRRFMIKDLLKAKLPMPEEDRTLTQDETGRKVIECLMPLLEERRYVQSKDNLELDLGLDSLKRLELIVSLEKALSMKLPETLASEVQTVQELTEKLRSLKAIPSLWQEAPTLDLLKAIIEKEPDYEEKKKAGFKRTAFEWPLTALTASIVKILFKIFFRLKIKGIENLPAMPFIIASNHTSYLDGFAIVGGIPLKILKNLYIQGYQRYFRGKLTSVFARLSHVILIDPETYLSKAVQLSAYALKKGGCLLIFPEGGRSFDGELMPFKKGIGILSVLLNVPVVPLKVSGTFKILPRGARIPRWGRITLTFGKPIMPLEVDLSKRPEGMDEYQFFSDMLRDIIERT
ncbi:MAG: AMP-binding protein [Nitrospirae bacterium]|nr:AMP-binding protein [Nitrospirota bacterium]